jgi:hypothetical protein
MYSIGVTVQSCFRNDRSPRWRNPGVGAIARNASSPENPIIRQIRVPIPFVARQTSLLQYLESKMFRKSL